MRETFGNQDVPVETVEAEEAMTPHEISLQLIPKEAMTDIMAHFDKIGDVKGILTACKKIYECAERDKPAELSDDFTLEAPLARVLFESASSLNPQLQEIIFNEEGHGKDPLIRALQAFRYRAEIRRSAAAQKDLASATRFFVNLRAADLLQTESTELTEPFWKREPSPF